MRRLTIRIEEETAELVEAGVQNLRESDKPVAKELSTALAIRHLLNEGIEATDGDLKESIPESKIKKWKVKQNKQERKDKSYLNKLAAYWRQNVQREFSKLYDDEAPASPRRVQIEMQHWRDELHDVVDDPDEIEAKSEWLDRKLDEYEDAVKFTEAVPDKGLNRVSDEIEIGADLWQLRPDGKDVVQHIQALSDSESYDPDAIVRAVAAEWGVATDAIDVLIDQIVADDTDVRQVLKGSHGDREDRFIDAVDPTALGPDSSLTELSEGRTAHIEEDEDEESVEDRISSIPTEPTAEHIDYAVQKLRLNGSASTTEDVLLRTDKIDQQPNREQAKIAVERAVEIVDEDEDTVAVGGKA